MTAVSSVCSSESMRVLLFHNFLVRRLLNFDDRAEASNSAEQYKDAEQNRFQRDNKDKQGMPGPNMSLANRDDEIERQNFSNEATLRFVSRQCNITCCAYIACMPTTFQDMPILQQATSFCSELQLCKCQVVQTSVWPSVDTSLVSQVCTSSKLMVCSACRYAREVEITNGRWAMLGFLAAITVEAATGKGILSQLIYYAKLSGLLGQQSGF